jgi:uncharacterized protein YndB with AHSA1/START domain
MRKTWLARAALLALAAPANAAVTDQSTTGFELQETAHIAASPDKVYAALIDPARWWSSDHTFSGSAANLSLDARAGGCWCEKLPGGGSVLHLTVVDADPGKTLRLRGALGPFQGTGMDGAMTIALKPNGQGTDLTLTYDIGGYFKGGFGPLPQGADGVLADQVARLKHLVETGSPDTRP